MAFRTKVRLAAGAALCLFGVSACTAANLLYGADGRIEMSRVTAMLTLVLASWAIITGVTVYFFHATLLRLLARDLKQLGTLIIKGLAEVTPDLKDHINTKVFPERVTLSDETAKLARENKVKIDSMNEKLLEALGAMKNLSRLPDAVDRLSENVNETNTLLKTVQAEHNANVLEVTRQSERQAHHEREIERLWDGVKERRHEDREPPDHTYRRKTDGYKRERR